MVSARLRPVESRLYIYPGDNHRSFSDTTNIHSLLLTITSLFAINPLPIQTRILTITTMEDYSQLIAIQEEEAIVSVSDNVQHTSTLTSFAPRRAKAPAPLDLGTVPGRSKSTSLNKTTSLGRRRSLLIRSQSTSDNSNSSISSSSSSSSSSSTTVSPSTSLSSCSSICPSPSSSISTPTRRRRSTANAHVERFSVHLAPECVPSSSTSTISSSNSDSRPHTPTSEEPEYDTVQIRTTSPGPISHNGYSNFYLSLPNGKWMLRYRTKDHTILGTEEVDMITI